MAFHGSPFEAEAVNERIEGEGRYTFPDGNVYIGQFKDGQFHGTGTIYFLTGGKHEAEWVNGVAIKEEFTFSDGLRYDERNWDYCTEQDRRFFSERVGGFLPGGPQLSNDPGGMPSAPIMTQDLGYCYYAKQDGLLHTFDGAAARKPTASELEWIRESFVLMSTSLGATATSLVLVEPTPCALHGSRDAASSESAAAPRTAAVPATVRLAPPGLDLGASGVLVSLALAESLWPDSPATESWPREDKAVLPLASSINLEVLGSNPSPLRVAVLNERRRAIAAALSGRPVCHGMTVAVDLTCSILIMDNFEDILGTGTLAAASVFRRMFLQEVRDAYGAWSPPTLIILVTSDMQLVLQNLEDAAVFFDHFIVPAMTIADRACLFRTFFSDSSCSDLEIDQLARQTKSHSLSDIVAALQASASFALSDAESAANQFAYLARYLKTTPPSELRGLASKVVQTRSLQDLYGIESAIKRLRIEHLLPSRSLGGSSSEGSSGRIVTLFLTELDGVIAHTAPVCVIASKSPTMR
ncbi:hypothetical protein HK105_208565 [Polyrhizophydium stewartii]|uniref:MORN repeat-containing protein 5 n=1 Tax=Polyrhizophydium stewartii TaxID=2732419 RepID=A0ABR4MXF8_9FUNG